jgi:hypothetical protein
MSVSANALLRRYPRYLLRDRIYVLSMFCQYVDEKIFPSRLQLMIGPRILESAIRIDCCGNERSFRRKAAWLPGKKGSGHMKGRVLGHNLKPDTFSSVLICRSGRSMGRHWLPGSGVAPKRTSKPEIEGSGNYKQAWRDCPDCSTPTNTSTICGSN